MEQFKMIMRLAKNDFKSRYSATVFGIIWAFIQPLMTVLVFWFVFQLGFKSAPVKDMPYMLWLIVAYIPWIYFSDILNFGVNALNDYSYLVKKVKFKVELLPLVRIISSAFVHIFFLGFIFLMFFCYREKLSFYCVQAIYYTVGLSILGWGLVMLLSALSTFFKDIAQFVTIILQIGFWATPIFWNKDVMVSGIVAQVLKINPLFYIVEGYRDSFLYRAPFWSHPVQTVYFWVLTIVIGFIGWRTFKKLRPHFADEL
jgi:hypothetical protein